MSSGRIHVRYSHDTNRAKITRTTASSLKSFIQNPRGARLGASASPCPRAVHIYAIHTTQNQAIITRTTIFPKVRDFGYSRDTKPGYSHTNSDLISKSPNMPDLGRQRRLVLGLHTRLFITRDRFIIDAAAASRHRHHATVNHCMNKLSWL